MRPRSILERQIADKTEAEASSPHFIHRGHYCVCAAIAVAAAERSILRVNEIAVLNVRLIGRR